MAQLWPGINEMSRTSLGTYRERDVLAVLEQSLPSSYHLFHSVGWHCTTLHEDRHGEVDIVVVDPMGNVLLIEVKAGSLMQTGQHLIKQYKAQARDAVNQTIHQFQNIKSRLAQAGIRTHVTSCLVLPDFRLSDQEVVGIDRQRVIDAADYEHLGAKVREILALASARDDRQHSGQARVLDFFSNQLDLKPDLDVLADQLRRATVRLSDGLATWVPRIHAPSGVYRIQSTAGSGKTQLAMTLLDQAAKSGQRGLYVCFNRTLADHVGHLAPVQAKVVSFHEMCVERYRHDVGEPDFSDEAVFGKVEAHFCQVSAGAQTTPAYDLLVIDEGQDFDLTWVQALCEHLKPDGRLYMLEDDGQRLYQRDAFDFPDAVQVSSSDNFRSPRRVCEVINALGLSQVPLVARSPFAGDVPGFRAYASHEELMNQTRLAVQSLVDRGIARSDIALISFRGIKTSVFSKRDSIGQFRLRRFTNHYDAAAQAVWTDGDILFDSVYRFKGQSAAGVVLTEVDFEGFGDIERRKLFVAMTRACLALEVVLSDRAQESLVKTLQEAADDTVA